jgi:branched-chain amino acid transport system ATP-binding protein
MSTPQQTVDLKLVVRGLSVNYGHVSAVADVSLDLRAGEVVAVVGPNGAGKTSTLRAIAGGLSARVRGEVELHGQRIDGWPAYKIVGCGMALVPEGRQVIAPLTVEENLLLGAYRQRSRARVAKLMDEVHRLFPVLRDRRESPSGLLSGGEQQMLAVGRALMSDPQVVLMDEPSMGLSPVMVDRLMDAVAEINAAGRSVLLVEQNVAAAFRVATRVYVLDQGRIATTGSTSDVRADPIVARAFLGLAGAAA